MSTDTTPLPGIPHEQAGSFPGFPYLVTRIAPALYHINLLPRDEQYARGRLYDIARRQVRINRLRACLALDYDAGLFLEPDGGEKLMPRIPSGGTVEYGRLVLCEPLPETEELAARRNLLRAFAARHNKEGTTLFFGDLLKGGRCPTEEERSRLRGRQDNGVPLGLSRCPACGEWRGECFDTLHLNADLIVSVSCRCQNDNRCAGCGNTFAARRLNANYYCEADGMIWHLAGFPALAHTCPGLPKKSAGPDFRVIHVNRTGTGA